MPEALALWDEDALTRYPRSVRDRFDALTRAGRADEAWAELTARAEAGSLAAVHVAIDVSGEPAATAWRERAARAGDHPAARKPARDRLAEGRPAEAEDPLRGLAREDGRTERLLQEVLAAQGRHDEVEQRLRASVERGDGTVYALAGLLRAANREAEADDVKRYGIEPGGATVAPWSVHPPGQSSRDGDRDP